MGQGWGLGKASIVRVGGVNGTHKNMQGNQKDSLNFCFFVYKGICIKCIHVHVCMGEHVFVSMYMYIPRETRGQYWVSLVSRIIYHVSFKTKSFTD